MLEHTKREMLELYETYCDMVYRICFLHLKNENDAYDAVQETFLKLMQHKKKFKGEEHAKAWLITTASNHCKDVLKSAWRKKRIDAEEAILENMPDKEYLANKEMENAVLDALIQLPEDYKNILYLYYYEGYQLNEIAKMLHRNASTIRSRFSKAKQLLRNHLEKEIG